MKLIDKGALVAEIEKELDSCEMIQMSNDNISAYEKGREDVCHKILSFIDTLKVKEVDLEKELSTYLEAVKATDEDIDFVDFANHFFELGIAASNKAQKGE